MSLELYQKASKAIGSTIGNAVLNHLMTVAEEEIEHHVDSIPHDVVHGILLEAVARLKK